jgi:hypothetical protein
MSDNIFRIIGIDVGWSNLAMVVVDVELDSHDFMADIPYKFKVVHANMTDLRNLKCKNNSNCIFQANDRKGGHLVHHYIENNDEWFSSANKIVIESQPIMSTHKDVEQLLLVYIKQRYSNGRQRHVRLIAPQSMHSHFQMSCEKVVRRIQVVEITKPFLEEMKVFKLAEYKDHLGDSMAFVLFYISVHLETHILKRKPNPFNKFKFN